MESGLTRGKGVNGATRPGEKTLEAHQHILFSHLKAFKAEV